MGAGPSFAPEALPLRRGARGDATLDLQRRLAALGFEIAPAEPGAFSDRTEAAVRRFQESRGLRVDGVCGTQTWSSLVEAGYRLGDRFLYRRAPLLRGDDVAELQHRLGALGFDAGRVDGIFGDHTGAALLEFQRNTGLTIDGICGSETVAALRRLGTRSGPGTNVASVREQETLLIAPRHLAGRRFAVGEMGGLGALADALGHALLDAGAIVAILHHPDGSVHAHEANEFAAEAYLSVSLLDGPGSAVSYFGTEGFQSVGGRQLAELVAAALPPALRGSGTTVRPMRLPVLRETRMPAVMCEIGPPPNVVEHGPALVLALELACTRWVEAPLGS